MATHKVEFVSYDEKYPCLCAGTLILKIDDNIVTFPPYCMVSGGRTWYSNNWGDAHVDKGEWSVDVPEEYVSLKEEIEKVVNENVPYGCCGGCL